MFTDEIMTEVHAIKDAIGNKYGSNLDELFKEIQIGEARLKATGIQVLDPPDNDKKIFLLYIAENSIRSTLKLG